MHLKSRTNIRGNRNPNAALTPENVLTIRRRYAEGVTQSELCKVYGVSITTIARVVNWQTWGWLKDEDSTMPVPHEPELPPMPPEAQAASVEKLRTLLTIEEPAPTEPKPE